MGHNKSLDIIAVFLVFGLSFCSSFNKTPKSENNKDIALVYKAFPALDEYSEGDIIGSQLMVYENGEAELFDLTYHPAGNETPHEQVLRSQYSFSDQKMDSLVNQLGLAEIQDYPSRIPAAGQSPQMRNAPAKTVTIYYEKTGDEIQVNLGAGRDQYPEGFFQLYNFLDRLIEEVNIKGEVVKTDN